MERPIGIGAKIYYWKQNFVLFFTGIATVLIGIIGTIILTIVANNINGDVSIEEYENIIKNGQTELGLIKSININENSTINGSHPADVSFTFQQNNSPIFNVFSNNPKMTDTLKTGNLIQLKTLDNKAIIVGLKPTTVPKKTFLFTIGLFSIGLIIFKVLDIKSKNLLYLVKNGLPLQATMTLKREKTHKPSNVQHSNNPTFFIVKYTYEDSKGNQIFGKGILPSSARVKNLRNNDKLSILIDPKDISNSTLYPFELAKKYNWNENK